MASAAVPTLSQGCSVNTSGMSGPALGTSDSRLSAAGTLKPSPSHFSSVRAGTLLTGNQFWW